MEGARKALIATNHLACLIAPCEKAQFSKRFRKMDCQRQIRRSRLSVASKVLVNIPALFASILFLLAPTVWALSITDYGAVGDAVQFYGNTTSNSVVVTTTNTFSGADIGKSIQVFDAGTVTVAPECQDLIATVTNVVNGTNLYVSSLAQRTLTNTFCTVGTDNRAAIQAAIVAANGSNVTITIPAGNYLILSQYNSNLFATVGVHFQKGGIHFVGAGTNASTLLGQGAWQIRPHDGKAARGFMIAVFGTVTNDYPISFRDLTLDGGLPNGYTGNAAFPASVVTGEGWDETHSAFDIRGGSRPPTSLSFSNVLVAHWRGEMFKSNDTSTNATIHIEACRFTDGNATALNIYPAWNVTNCVFDNLLQVSEYYMQYSRSPSYFRGNLMTNIYRTGLAFNGATGTNPPFHIENNQFLLNNVGYAAIGTTPAANLYITSNLFSYPVGSHNNALNFGMAGWQGTFHNSNLVVRGNTFVNAKRILIIQGATGPTGQNRVEGVRVFHNTSSNSPTETLLVCYDWSTNVHFYSNSFTTNASVAVSSGLYGAEFARMDLSNDYWTALAANGGTTNHVSYATGSRYRINTSYNANTRFALVTTNASQIPSGAQILIQNNNTSGTNAMVFLNSEMTQGPVIVPHGRAATFRWSNGGWQTVTKMSPPSDLRVIDSEP